MYNFLHSVETVGLLSALVLDSFNYVVIIFYVTLWMVFTVK